MDSPTTTLLPPPPPSLETDRQEQTEPNRSSGLLKDTSHQEVPENSKAISFPHQPLFSLTSTSRSVLTVLKRKPICMVYAHYLFMDPNQQPPEAETLPLRKLTPLAQETMTDSEQLGEDRSLLPSDRNANASISPFSRRRLTKHISFVIISVLIVGIAVGAVLSRQKQDQSISGSQPDLVLSIPSETKSKKEHKKSKSNIAGEQDNELSYCQDGKYSKRTLKLAYELPFVSLFKDTKGQKKFEASSVVVSGDGNAYAVCDSSWAVSKFDSKLEPFQEGNIQVGDPNREEEDSGYEALFQIEDGSFYVVRESIQHSDASYHAIIEKLVLEGENYSVAEKCSAEFTFEGASKGFEGAIGIRDLNNELVILGLCEGNHCSEANKDDVGHGKLVAMRQGQADDGSCQWSTIRTIDIPPTAAFRDYSAISLHSASGKVAISSQEESQLWVGKLQGQEEDGRWDVDAMEFKENKGKIFDFPKNDSCQTVYCNVEGVHFVNAHTIMAVSDKMKSGGKQDFRCFDKDQSVHVFVIP